jgi:hypothetical protein
LPSSIIGIDNTAALPQRQVGSFRIVNDSLRLAVSRRRARGCPALAYGSRLNDGPYNGVLRRLLWGLLQSLEDVGVHALDFFLYLFVLFFQPAIFLLQLLELRILARSTFGLAQASL